MFRLYTAHVNHVVSLCGDLVLPTAGRARAHSCLGAAVSALLCLSVSWQQTEHQLKASESHLEMLCIACYWECQAGQEEITVRESDALKER